jgi:hypothetical protein
MIEDTSLSFYKTLEKINHAINEKYPLILLVSQNSRRLMDLSHRMGQNQYRHLDINSALSDFLIETNNKFEGDIVQEWLMDSVKSIASMPNPVLCSGIDLLFEPRLKLDPLKLFQKVSQYTPLVVCWPGSYDKGKLAYAVPYHHHYREWSTLDPSIFILGLDK